MAKQDIMRMERECASQEAEATARLSYSIGFAQSGLQALTLINGGALVALFSFVGSSSAVTFDLAALWWAFGIFAAGLVFNICAYLGAHLSQDRFYIVAQYLAWNAQDAMADKDASHDPMPPYKAGSIAQMAAMLCAILALAAFIAGCGFALSGVASK
ncbi:hypothetical protein CJD35_11415 [Sphingobium xenophagum]|uniref:Uncharacterized protein n=1 Tax=Sphingobium xenophagum TaxID=121428 RepID=A0A249MV09_SPHXE|nr:hypothetical protein [Sphingobium xenophagum]ASY44979.1 hypothetical protein CJD35_11415 [Sphingobium xenophagum]